MLQLIELGHHGRVHALELGAPFIEGGRVDAVGQAHLWDGGSTLDSLEYVMSWLSVKRGPVMKSPREMLRENSTTEQSQFTGGTVGADQPFQATSNSANIGHVDCGRCSNYELRMSRKGVKSAWRSPCALVSAQEISAATMVAMQMK